MENQTRRQRLSHSWGLTYGRRQNPCGARVPELRWIPYLPGTIQRSAGGPRRGGPAVGSRACSAARTRWRRGRRSRIPTTMGATMRALKAHVRGGRLSGADGSCSTSPPTSRRRLGEHEAAGRIGGEPVVTSVPGGRTPREVAEHRRIQEITGGVPARLSPRVSNKVDPIGPDRRDLLEEK